MVEKITCFSAKEIIAGFGFKCLGTGEFVIACGQYNVFFVFILEAYLL